MVDWPSAPGAAPGITKGSAKPDTKGIGQPKAEQEIENIYSRIRVLEERYNNLRAEVKLTEDNMLKKNKKLGTDLKTLGSDISELRQEIDQIKERTLLIVKELQGLAKKGDVQSLQKYIELWEPMNFVTHQELHEVIEEKLAQMMKANQN
ncbi:hypothetical protein HYU14_06825 [Candidatus Woesearchaeota archaeon]|nr:hypothetical protein [Candidatus Woesearchaeota archaeon]